MSTPFPNNRSLHALEKYAKAMCRAHGKGVVENVRETAEYALVYSLYTSLETRDTERLLNANPPPDFSEIYPPAMLEALKQQHPHLAEEIEKVYTTLEVSSKGTGYAQDMLNIIQTMAQTPETFGSPTIITLDEARLEGKGKRILPGSDKATDRFSLDF